MNEIAVALAKAQAEMANAPLNKVNPHFKSKYADLASIRDAVVPALAKHGIAVVQTMEPTSNGLSLRTSLIHGSGQRIDSWYPLPTAAKPHEMGSALTYAKRYSLSAIACISADDDDDGNAANEAAKNGKPTASPERSTGPALISTGQLNELTTLAEEVKVDLEAFLHWLEVPSMDFIPAYDFLRAKKALEGKNAKT